MRTPSHPTRRASLAPIIAMVVISASVIMASRPQPPPEPIEVVCEGSAHPMGAGTCYAR